MKLTNYMRDAIINAIMDDVPYVDHKETARVALQKKAIDLLPPKLKALHKEFGHWFKHDWLWGTPGEIGRVQIVSMDDAETKKQMQADADFWQSIEQLSRDDAQQTDTLNALRSKIRAAIYSCTTVKSAHELLPEFVKYLPALDATPDRSVPVVANLVADLSNAGWPKDKPLAKLPKRASK